MEVYIDIKINIVENIEAINDFSNVKLFTVPTMEVVFTKGQEMIYPMNNYFIWNQIGKKTAFNSHSKWLEVRQKLNVEKGFRKICCLKTI